MASVRLKTLSLVKTARTWLFTVTSAIDNSVPTALLDFPSEEAIHQLKAKLERGAAQAERGELVDGDEVFGELREMIEERRRSKSKKR